LQLIAIALKVSLFELINVNEVEKQQILNEPVEEIYIKDNSNYKNELLAFLKRENEDLRSDKKLLQRIIEVKL
jgi:hypothetical protein